MLYLVDSFMVKEISGQFGSSWIVDSISIAIDRIRCLTECRLYLIKIGGMPLNDFHSASIVLLWVKVRFRVVCVERDVRYLWVLMIYEPRKRGGSAQENEEGKEPHGHPPVILFNVFAHS